MDYCLTTIIEYFDQKIDRYEFLTNLEWLLKGGKRGSCPGLLALEDTTYHKHTRLLTNTWVLSAGPALSHSYLPCWLTLFRPQRNTRALCPQNRRTVTKCHEGLGAMPLLTPEMALLRNVGNIREQGRLGIEKGKHRLVSWLENQISLPGGGELPISCSSSSFNYWFQRYSGVRG